jgi:hypothetical protein
MTREEARAEETKDRPRQLRVVEAYTPLLLPPTTTTAATKPLPTTTIFQRWYRHNPY